MRCRINSAQYSIHRSERRPPYMALDSKPSVLRNYLKIGSVPKQVCSARPRAGNPPRTPSPPLHSGSPAEVFGELSIAEAIGKTPKLD